MKEERNYKVYMHTFPNGKKYIGITKRNVNERWLNGRGYIHNEHMTRAIKKYGWRNITHEVLIDSLTMSEAEQWETALIAQHRSNDRNYGYNIEEGGRAHNTSKETREKLSKRGKKVNQYSLDGTYIQTWNRMKDISEHGVANHQKVYKCCIGENKSAGGFQWKYYLGETDNIGKYTKKDITGLNNPMGGITGEKNKHSKKINAYGLDGKYIKTYFNAREAAKEIGISYKTISEIARMRKSHGQAKGYQFRFYEGNTNDINKYVKQIKRGKENYQYGKISKNAKEVIQYDLNMNKICVYKSNKIAGEATGTNMKCISNCARGTQKTAGGYIWQYA